jgi:stalled ribosome alternative rescue factor ArfA
LFGAAHFVWFIPVQTKERTRKFRNLPSPISLLLNIMPLLERNLVQRLIPIPLLPALLLTAGWARGEEKKPAVDSRYEQEMRPLLQKFCSSCHGEKDGVGGVSLHLTEGVAGIQKDQVLWRKVLRQIRERSMPPQGSPQPKQDQRDKLTLWLQHTLDTADESLLPKNPGSVILHRLNRREYNNTVRDLFGVSIKPADKFPADSGGGGGFDNNADTLFVPPILMERYLAAAGEVLDAAPSQRVFVVKPGKGITAEKAAQQIFTVVASRAYRRPAEPAETALLMRLYSAARQRKETHEKSVKFALKAVLVSPQFLFRVEKDRPGAQPYRITDYELASRLSYFLWASMPDETLLQLAAQNKLHEPTVLEAQVKRMLASPKVREFADSFTSQWLRARDLYTSALPDGERFPNWTPTLRDAMYQEPVLLFSDVMQNDASVLTLLDANYTYLNEELAKHYGVAGVMGSQMRRVALADKRRGGVLTMGSVLTLTSYPQRTSPVLRGKWILGEILGSPSPPPPPVVATLSTNDAPENGLTFRQRLEKHRKDPACAGCHSRMDPLGFGLENFDATGRWRDAIANLPVDAAGELTTGEKFTGPVELKALLLQRKTEFVHNLVERMLSYALGRGLEAYDLPAVRRITQSVLKSDCRSHTLIVEIVKSYPFQFRKN